eukprot:TRINITY_DN401_c0_g1_i10.p1 TRINITY_DN401_c0_g1~~TRINITY_DN401_c0_g1_i10.p1  ORF type:complete len:137 (-),score=74.85 TRINITY_DN401_c0_g1_i10:1828-2238(-)
MFRLDGFDPDAEVDIAVQIKQAITKISPTALENIIFFPIGFDNSTKAVLKKLIEAGKGQVLSTISSKINYVIIPKNISGYSSMTALQRANKQKVWPPIAAEFIVDVANGEATIEDVSNYEFIPDYPSLQVLSKNVS